jgi:hypothetical protein
LLHLGFAHIASLIKLEERFEVFKGSTYRLKAVYPCLLNLDFFQDFFGTFGIIPEVSL